MSKSSNLFFRLQTKLKKYFTHRDVYLEYKAIPIIINNFNRLKFLEQMIVWLEKAGYCNIFIIDNNSDYPPLLEYYRKTPHTVYRLDKNVGFLALWKTIIFSRFSNTYYVYTDPDILPVEECTEDVILHFKSLLEKYKYIDKVGFSLKIDDIPDCYPLKENVVKWESKFWTKEIEIGIFDAPIDTTFALYRPGVQGGSELKAIRTGYPYVAQHLPWYIDPSKYSNEEIYFQSKASSASSWTSRLTGKSTIPKY